MHVEISENAADTLRSLMTEGSSFEQLVELAITELAVQRDEAGLPQWYVDPQTLQVLTEVDLKLGVQKGLDDIAAGRVTRFESDEDLRLYLENVKQRGRAELAKFDE